MPASPRPDHLHLFLLHGLGASGDDLLPLGHMLVEAAEIDPARVSVHTPHAPVQPVTLNGGARMPSWFDIHGLDRNDPIDLPGIEQAVGEIVELIDRETGGEPFLIGGFSQGGVVAMRAAMQTQSLPLGVILLSTWLPDREHFDVPTERRQLAVFVGHGLQDDLVMPAAADRLVATLRDHALTAIADHRYPMGHSVVPEEMQDLAVWLRAVLG